MRKKLGGRGRSGTGHCLRLSSGRRDVHGVRPGAEADVHDDDSPHMHLGSPGDSHFSWRGFRELGLDLLALLWPTECVVCGAPDRDFCSPCQAEMRRQREARAVGAPHLSSSQSSLRSRSSSSQSSLRSLSSVLQSSLPSVSQSCLPSLPDPPVLMLGSGQPVPVCAAGDYSGGLRALLLALKHQGQTGFARELGLHLRTPVSEALALQAGVPPVLVCVPSRTRKVRERGYRHVEMILQKAVGTAGVRGLVALRGRTGQVGLRQVERERNAQRIALRGRYLRLLRHRGVVVVDDILTTGATLRAACETLSRARIPVVAVVVLCVVVRRDAKLSDGELQDVQSPV